MERRQPLETLAAGSLLTSAGIVVSGVLSLAVVIAVTRGLGPIGSGVFFQLVALFSILASLSELGAPAGLVRTIPRYQTFGRTGDVRGAVTVALWPVGILSSLIAVALVLLAPRVTVLLGLDTAHGSSYLRAIAPFLPLAALSSVTLAATRGFGTMVTYVWLENIAKPALRPVLILVAMASGLGPMAALVAWAVPSALMLPVAALAMVTLLRHSEQAVSSGTERMPLRALASEFWRFAAPRGLASIFQVAILWLDVILVGSLRSTEEAGVYAAVSRLVAVGVFAIEGVRLAIAPQVSAALARQDGEGAQLLYRVGTWWLVGVSWPLYLTLAIFAPFVLRIFGSEFERGAPALLIVSLAMLVGVGTGNVSVVLLMGGKSVWNLANTAAALFVNVLLNILLIPVLGMSGAALAWAASLLVNNVVPLWQVRRSLHLDPFGRGFAIVAGMSTVCYAGIGIGIRATLGLTPSAFLLTAAIATGIYAWVLFRFREELHLAALGQAFAAGMGWIRGTGARSLHR